MTRNGRERPGTGFLRPLGIAPDTQGLTPGRRGNGRERPGTARNKGPKVLRDHPRHVLGTLESLERLGTTHKCTGYPQMYLHACSPSRLGARYRYLRIGSLAHYCSRPGHSPNTGQL